MKVYDIPQPQQIIQVMVQHNAIEQSAFKIPSLDGPEAALEKSAGMLGVGGGPELLLEEVTLLLSPAVRLLDGHDSVMLEVAIICSAASRIE